jgi:hypothetical protein
MCLANKRRQQIGLTIASDRSASAKTSGAKKQPKAPGDCKPASGHRPQSTAHSPQPTGDPSLRWQSVLAQTKLILSRPQSWT